MKFLSSLPFLSAMLIGCSTPTTDFNIKTTAQIFGYEFRRQPSLSVSSYFEYRDENEEIQVTIIRFESAEEARVFMEDRLFQFRTVFEPKRVDYPGQFSRSIECASGHKPAHFRKAILAGQLEYFAGYAGANKVAGSCTADLIRYRYVYALALCESGNHLLEIERFSGKEEGLPDAFIQRVTCRDVPTN